MKTISLESCFNKIYIFLESILIN